MTTLEDWLNHPLTASCAENVDGGWFLKDVELDQVLLISATVAEWLGLPRREYRKVWGTPASEYWPRHYREYHQDDLRIYESGKQSEPFLEDFRTLEGDPITLMTKKWPVPLFGRKLLFIQAMNITTLEEQLNSRLLFGSAVPDDVMEARRQSASVAEELMMICKEIQTI